jgi:hypothetical protein
LDPDIQCQLARFDHVRQAVAQTRLSKWHHSYLSWLPLSLKKGKGPAKA